MINHQQRIIWLTCHALRAITVMIVWTLAGCADLSLQSDAIFKSAPTIAIGAPLPTTIVNVGALGMLDTGEAINITITSETAHSVLVLALENEESDTAVLVGGGPAGEPFTHQAHERGMFFVFILYAPDSISSTQISTVAVNRTTDLITPRLTRQLVVVDFETGFLTEPGLWDPTNGTIDDKDFLTSIESSVRAEVLRSLQQFFEDTPIEVIDEVPTQSDEPFSRLTFSPQRVLADQDDTNDSALPPPDPTRPQCQVRVVFGEVLPRGTNLDPGNRVHNDAAMVYVGSFQGRGQACWTSAVSSLNNVVLTLTQTAAHEIGHLVGLFHVEQIDIMNRSATLAFLRNLEFARGQIQLDRLLDGQIVSEVFPSIIQEPQRYYNSVFAQENALP